MEEEEGVEEEEKEEEERKEDEDKKLVRWSVRPSVQMSRYQLESQETAVMIVKNDRLSMFKLYYRGISTTGLHATSSSSLISCVVVVVIVVVVGLLLSLLLLLLLLVCFHRYRVVVVVVGFSPFENKAGPTDGRTTQRAYGLTDTYSYIDA